MLRLFLTFLKISISAFGGGAVITSLIQKEFVNTGLISSNEFIKVIAMSQATPGPIAGSIATYVGYLQKGTLGIIIANIAIALPSFIIVILFSNFLNKYKGSKIMKTVFEMLRAVAAALVFSVLLFFINASVFNNKALINLYDYKNYFNFHAFIAVLILLLCTEKFKLSPVKTILVSAILGVLIL
jgi:chromate transporter